MLCVCVRVAYVCSVCILFSVYSVHSLGAYVSTYMICVLYMCFACVCPVCCRCVLWGCALSEQPHSFILLFLNTDALTVPASEIRRWYRWHRFCSCFQNHFFPDLPSSPHSPLQHGALGGDAWWVVVRTGMPVLHWVWLSLALLCVAVDKPPYSPEPRCFCLKERQSSVPCPGHHGHDPPQDSWALIVPAATLVHC